MALTIAVSAASSAPTTDPLTGQLIEITDEHGRTKTVRIDAVEIDSKDPEGDTYLYSVSVQTLINGNWHNLCQADREGVAKAIALTGHWEASGRHVDSARITLACTSGVLAKCVRWGYKPWQMQHGRSLRPLHQACTRMARADYCGDGRIHTREGTPINVVDVLGVQQHASVSGMDFEAAWGPDGALALARGRFTDAEAIIAECPYRLGGRRHIGVARPSLDTLRQQYPNALLFNESHPVITSP